MIFMSENISNPITDIIGGDFQPFAFMKPVQQAIEKSQSLNFLSDATNTILFGIDIFIMVCIGLTLILFCFGIGRYYFKGYRGKDDETKDVKGEEIKRKKELKDTIKATVGLSIVFVVLPLIVTMICGFISI